MCQLNWGQSWINLVKVDNRLDLLQLSALLFQACLHFHSLLKQFSFWFLWTNQSQSASGHSTFTAASNFLSFIDDDNNESKREGEGWRWSANLKRED